MTIDWHGEENEKEIEQFIESKLKIKTNWIKVNRIRKGADEEKQRDGTFIIDLLKAIENDLQAINRRLIFLDLSWDAYVFTVVDQASYKQLIAKAGTDFHGTDKLQK